MPVWLDAIPEKSLEIRRPVTGRWLLFLAMVMLIGVSLTLWNWTSERTGFVFWFTALGMPFCTWGLIFSIRRFAYKAGQVAAESRNIERDRLLESETGRGQRCAWILGTCIQTSAGNKPEALLAALSGNAPLFEYSQPRGRSTPVRYAALTDFQHDLAVQLKKVVSKLSGRFKEIVDVLPAEIDGWLIVDCDSDIENQILEPLKHALMQKTGRSFRQLSGIGLAAFDDWLDRRWEHPGILVVVTLSLSATPKENDADAITMMVLSNRPANAYPAAACLHRPETGSSAALSKTLARALLWAGIDPKELRGAWFTGTTLNQGSDWNKACEDSEVIFSLTVDNVGIDYALGYAGYASPWLAITLADATCKNQGPQIIAAQPNADKDDVWVTVVTKE